MRKNKKQRTEEKRRRLVNKKLIKKYPWLKPYNVWTGKIWKNYNYETTWADDLPNGWRKAFGDMMFEEIDEVLKRTNTTIYIEQIKEKYGQLRFYCNAHQEVQDIINDYSTLSENICIVCGKPDVPMLDTGWISPVCKECFERNQKTNKWAPRCKYEDYIISKGSTMVSERRWRRFTSNDDTQDFSRDISDKAQKIRNRSRV